MVQWLRLHDSTAGSTGLIPGQGTKILQAAWHSQRKKKKKERKKLEGWAGAGTQGFVGHVTKYLKCSVEALQIDWTGQGISEGEGSVSFTFAYQLSSRECLPHTMGSLSLCLMSNTCLAFLPRLP